MKLIDDTLAALSIAAPQRFSNLTVYPLTAPADLDADYLVLDEALRRKLAPVTEVSCGGSVPELAFDNQADEGVLLLDGEELVGARQNRVLNITILVGGHKNIVIPVSSVEHGRWRYNSDEFASADRALFSKARGKKMRQVSASMRESGTRRSDQGEVWADIAQKQASFCVNSATEAMGDVYDKEKARLDEYVNAIEPLPRQCGAVFAVDGKVAGIELFDSPATCACYLPKIVRSYAMDAAQTRQPDGVPPVEEAVRRFIEQMKAAATQTFKALGEGDDVRLEGGSITGGALVRGERVVHLAAFAMDADSPKAKRRTGARRSPLS